MIQTCQTSNCIPFTFWMHFVYIWMKQMSNMFGWLRKWSVVILFEPRYGSGSSFHYRHCSYTFLIVQQIEFSIWFNGTHISMNFEAIYQQNQYNYSGACHCTFSTCLIDHLSFITLEMPLYSEFQSILCKKFMYAIDLQCSNGRIIIIINNWTEQLINDRKEAKWALIKTSLACDGQHTLHVKSTINLAKRLNSVFGAFILFSFIFRFWQLFK